MPGPSAHPRRGSARSSSRRPASPEGRPEPRRARRRSTSATAAATRRSARITGSAGRPPPPPRPVPPPWRRGRHRARESGRRRRPGGSAPGRDVQPLGFRAPPGAVGRGRLGSGIERDPADVVEVDLHPRMGVEVAHAVLAAFAVQGARREAGHDPRRDARHPQHQSHRSRELLAVADLVLEQEGLERIGLRRRPLAVDVLRAQVVLHPVYGVVDGGRSRGEAAREGVGLGVGGVAEQPVGFDGAVGVAAPERHDDRRAVDTRG